MDRKTYEEVSGVIIEEELTKWEAAKAWMKNNVNLFEKEHLISRTQAYYGLTPQAGLELYEMIQKEIKVENTIKEWIQRQRVEISDALNEGYYKKSKPMAHWRQQYKPTSPGQGGPKMSKQLNPQEEEALEKFLYVTKADPAELKAMKDAGKFSKIGMIIDIAKWYEEKGFVTAKQYDVLKKNVFDKVNDPKWLRRHKELLEERIKFSSPELDDKIKQLKSMGKTKDEAYKILAPTTNKILLNNLLDLIYLGKKKKNTLKAEAQKSKDSFTCTICDRKFRDIKDARFHVKMEHGHQNADYFIDGIQKESTTSGWGYKQYTVTSKKRKKK